MCCFSNSAAQRKALIFNSAKLFTWFIFLFFEKKVGKLPVSHRYNRLPLLPSDSGGFQQELVAQDLPGAKVEKFSLHANNIFNLVKFVISCLIFDFYKDNPESDSTNLKPNLFVNFNRKWDNTQKIDLYL